MKTRRPKVAAACHECRSRKVKCDGQTPVCEPCKIRGFSETCRWDPDPTVSKRKSNTARVSYLEKRIKDLESLYSTHQQTCLNGHVQCPELNRLPEGPNIAEQRDVETSAIDLRFDTLEEDAPSEVVHPMIGPSEEERQPQEFFGKSSAGTFMRNVKRLVEKRLGCTVSSSNRITGSPNALNRGSFSHTDYVLPPRNVADKLMAFYWEYLHPTMPYLEPTQMQEEYECLWNGKNLIQQERSFHCLLNVMFALSSQLDESIEVKERFRMARMFWGRARDLLDVLERGSLQAVQYCLLLGEYFLGTTDPHSAWMYVGLAIRTAQSLGLHRPEISQQANGARERELFRRIWHGCILMDRSLSVSYGRPCMIGPKSALAVPLPAAVGDQNDHSRDDFYVCCLKLYEVLHDVAFNFYSINSRGEILNIDNPTWTVGTSEANSSTLELEKKLAIWEASLPDYLNIESAGETDSKYRRQATILYQRKLHVRILLLRPILSDTLSEKLEHCDQAYRPLSSRIADQYGITCAMVALDSINIIHRELFRPQVEVVHLSAWYHNILYLYTSATVLIAALLCPAILVVVEETTIRLHWAKALESLQKYREFDPSIPHLITTLKILFGALPQITSVSAIQDNSRSLTRNAHSGQYDPHLTETVSLSSEQAFQPLNTPVLTDASLFDDLLAFDVEFDLNDTSWLTTLPYDSFGQF